MSHTDNMIPGLSNPKQSHLKLGQIWRHGTSAGKLRRRQLILVGIAVLMGLLRGADGDGGAGIVSGIVMIVVFSPMLIIWNRQISSIHRRGAMLDAGRFQVTEAEVNHVLANHWKRHYVGAAHARLANGMVLKYVEVPYAQAAKTGKQGGPFPAWLVVIEGEDKLVAFLR